MKAVNLIPAESGRTGGRSGVGVYVLLGVLGVLLVSVAAYVLTNNTVTSRRAELADLQTQLAAVQAQADAARPYRDFASLAQARVDTVRQLGESRFDWQRALGDLSKVIPDNIWLSSLLGTVTTGVSIEGASSGATSTLRAALPNPAIELKGCTTSHDGVVRLISRLRLVDSVQRVSLADSVKSDDAAGSSSGTSTDCRYGHRSFPQFDLVIFFKPLPALPTATQSTATGAVAPAAAATPTPAASTTPAPTGAPSTGSDAR
jgi:Tfp pilus assembly protein PilN